MFARTFHKDSRRLPYNVVLTMVMSLTEITALHLTGVIAAMCPPKRVHRQDGLIFGAGDAER